MTSDPLEQPSEGALVFLPKPARRRGRLEFALPTINVIFLLMLYFLVAGTLVQRSEMGVAPPQTSHYPADRLPRPLLLVTETGALELDGQKIDIADIAGLGQAAIENAHASALNVLAPADAPAEPFLALLARLDAAKLPVRLVTIDRADGRRP